ncbi:hypothetical protein DL98DRAFT_581052 [Cadophora sp. DSE1049]|nr:hypothetical protein DL98DRAFT_581052 [Cadophora sp. DSE1049]
MADSNMDSTVPEQSKEYPRYPISSTPCAVTIEPVDVEPPSDCDTEIEDEITTEVQSEMLSTEIEGQHSTSESKKSAGKNDKEYKWEFLLGTDLSLARFGEPDLSKFFLCRQLVYTPEVKDLCEYAKWRTFDWNDTNSITHLNRWRGLTRLRTAGKIAVPHPPWTQMEKNALKSLVERELRDGKTKKTINWDIIATDLMSHFKNIVQPVGVPMAQNSTSTTDGSEKVHSMYAKKLSGNRVGSIERSATAVKEQATKYADIKLMLQQSASENERHGNNKEGKMTKEVSSQSVPRKKARRGATEALIRASASRFPAVYEGQMTGHIIAVERCHQICGKCRIFMCYDLCQAA